MLEVLLGRAALAVMWWIIRRLLGIVLVATAIVVLLIYVRGSTAVPTGRLLAPGR